MSNKSGKVHGVASFSSLDTKKSFCGLKYPNYYTDVHEEVTCRRCLSFIVACDNVEAQEKLMEARYKKEERR